VVWGLPRGRFQSAHGLIITVILAGVELGSLTTCPNRPSLLLLMMVATRANPVRYSGLSISTRDPAGPHACEIRLIQ